MKFTRTILGIILFLVLASLVTKYSLLFSLSTTFILAVASNAAVTGLFHGSFGRYRSIEHGSANWGKRKLLARTAKGNGPRVIYTLTDSMPLSIDMGGTETYRNNNTVVIGASGSGKSRCFILPQIYSAYSSYVITDPKGALYSQTHEYLASKGYSIYRFSLRNMSASAKYNPLAYTKTPEEIMRLVACIIANTKGEGEKSDFWERSETALLQAIFAYLVFESKEKPTLPNAIELIMKGENLDGLFEKLDTESSFAARQYTVFSLAPEKTKASILISSAVRLSAFNIPEVRDLTAFDSLCLDSSFGEKTALFIETSDEAASHSFIAALLYSQLFSILARQADANESGRLAQPITFLLDEFANIGKIPNFESFIATARSRGLAVMLCVQSLAQLKSMYDGNWETITGNCDSLLYLGGLEKSTLEYISELCGTATAREISHTDSSDDRTYSNSPYQRPLITPDEVSRLGPNECILIIRGLQPYRSKKYNIENHPEYRKHKLGA
ncbi:MAG: type IV secretory system conjugative DNA transfer family protein [Eubacteriaceae bacterium]|nr:type IV secretory system conjugative DNA transfer family protein [Eubacteriaceae bacterium]